MYHLQKGTYVEPCKSTVRLPQPAFVLAASALLHPGHGPNPVLWLHIPKVFLLVVQIRRDVMAHQGEEAGDCKCLVAVAENLKVDGIVVVKVAEERDDGIDGYHEQDADDTRFC